MAQSKFQSTYVFEVPKYSAEANFKKSIRKTLRARLLGLKCRGVVVGTPLEAKNPPAWSHQSDNYEEVLVTTRNCTLIQKPKECDGTMVSRWLFEDLTTDRDWIVCRKP